ncbi:MinD/ParA family protein [Streptomyces sp. C8S0]|uniref:MinD/ParA family ATP-binding protein n=1 Tax=Streptomyces sp. C8S0 TaxID=2585716 RepID=UPI001866172E|nr:hypothetical protein [Streptomyces sp. C8S0]
MVVEADGSGGDLMIRFGLPHTPSLLDVAAAARQPHPGSLLGAVSELPFGVRAVVAPPGHGPSSEATRLLGGEGGLRVLRGADGDTGVVLMDVGRLSGDVEPLLRSADQVVVVTRGGAEPLTHVSAYGIDADLRARATLAVVGPSPYPVEEIAGALDIERVAALPWDARCVAAMSGARSGVLRTSGFRTPPLMVAARALAARLVASPERRSEDGPGHGAPVAVAKRGRGGETGDEGSES